MTTDPVDAIENEPKLWRHALGILAASTLIRIALASIVPIFADEAYYWEWSRHLAGGYFDHPPMIAVLIAGGTAIFGDTPLGVRIFPILSGTAGGLAIAAAALHLGGARAARYAALAFCVLPLAAVGLVIATPDAPLLAGIAWTLYGVLRALSEPLSSARSTMWWIVAGLSIGLAMASKYTGVLVPIALLFAFIVHAPLRSRLRTPGPWVAVAVASLVMVPVLLWNAEHDWISFQFQLGHGLGAVSQRESMWQREFRLVSSQFGLVTPILFVLLVGAIVRDASAPRDDRRFPLAFIAVFCALFFFYSATRRSVEENWPAIMWLPAIVLLASAHRGLRTAWERRAIWLAGGLSAIVLLHAVVPFLPLPARRDQVARTHGWDRLAQSVDSARRELGATDSINPPDVAANRYQDAALLAFYLPGNPTISALNLGARSNQYELWSRFRDRAQVGDDLLLVLELPRDSIPGPIIRLTGHFGSITPGPIIPIRRGDEVHAQRRLWVLADWLGTWPTNPSALIKP